MEFKEDSTIPATQQRVLAVLDAVLIHGPVTLEQLTLLLPVSQSGIYRALQNLISIGWVQPAVLRKGFVINADFATRFGQCPPSFPYLGDGKYLKKTIQKFPNINLDIGMLTKMGLMYRVDTTQRTAFRPHAVTITESILARAAISALPPKNRMVFLRRYLAAAPEMEREKSRKPNFAKLFTFSSSGRIILASTEIACAFAFTLENGDVGALHLRPKKLKVSQASDLRRAAFAILQAQTQKRLPNMEIHLTPHEIEDIGL